MRLVTPAADAGPRRTDDCMSDVVPRSPRRPSLVDRCCRCSPRSCTAVRNFGTGGTGELVVPRDLLRDRPLDLAATSRPTDPARRSPATQPRRPDDRAGVAARAAAGGRADDRGRPPAGDGRTTSTCASSCSTRRSPRDVAHRGTRRAFEALFTANVDYARPTRHRQPARIVAGGRASAPTSALDVPLLTGGTIRLSVPVQPVRDRQRVLDPQPVLHRRRRRVDQPAAAPRGGLRRQRPAHPHRVLRPTRRRRRARSWRSSACWPTPTASTGGCTRPGEELERPPGRSTTWPSRSSSGARRQVRGRQRWRRST